MDRTEQLAWERRSGRIAAAAAFAGVALTIANIGYRASALPSPPDEDRDALRVVEGNGGDLIALSVLQLLTMLCLAVVLLYLYRVIRYRRPELLRVARVLAIAGPLLAGLASLLLQFDRIDVADEFTSLPERLQTEARAEDLLESPPVVITALGAGGQLSLAIAFVLIGVNAIRAGIMSRFVGIIGVIIGALYVLPLAGGPLIIQVFWLAAVGLLFLDRWPGGRGPAWDRGEAIPWPSAQQRGAGRAPEEQWSGDEEPAYDEPEAEDSADKRAQRAANKRRRKRKQRR